MKDDSWKGEHLLKVSDEEKWRNSQAAKNVAGRLNGKSPVTPESKERHDRFIKMVVREILSRR